ncbi:HupE/UreJ family protein [Aurantimonas sp. A2-1-M11]|uniref:HupE/UreJ family protein n=1 Tax=Aurantimonas sp. A2-1-M11 TaxID=3113712 RepID=UPI002F939914
MLTRFAIAAATLIAATAPAFAHLDPAAHGSLLAGVSHPLFGWDHVLVMVAVGLWAAMIGGRALWVVAAAFVAMMGIGYAMAVAGFPLPFVEPVILASVVAVGLMVAAAVRLPVPAAAMVVGAFALFHGSAHGGELGSAGALSFGLGFVLATAGLHAVGIGLGTGLSRIASPLLVRGLGATSAVAGLYLMAG